MKDDLIPQIIELLDRSNVVYEWPADEAELHREWRGDWRSRHYAVLELRAQKILDLIQGVQPKEEVPSDIPGSSLFAGNPSSNLPVIIRDLRGYLGPIAVSILTGILDFKLLDGWQKEPMTVLPTPEQEKRLLFAYNIFRAGNYNFSGITVWQWFYEQNQLLGGVSPLTAISKDQFTEVEKALNEFCV
jgi:hypothetical protein